MSRIPRCRTLSEVNHIIMRGIGHVDLFLTEEDFRRFLNTLMRFKKTDAVTISAYCLMNNHIHLLLQANPEQIPVFLKRVEVSYAFYFNGLYSHTGHLFQNRYKSRAVLDDSGYLTVLRYILRNPEEAGICRWSKYLWSSAASYLSGKSDGLTDISRAYNMIGGRENLYLYIDKHDEQSDSIDCEFEHDLNIKRKIIPDNDAFQIICQVTGLEFPALLQNMDGGTRKELLAKLKKRGLTVRQLERITGVNRNSIQRAK